MLVSCSNQAPAPSLESGEEEISKIDSASDQFLKFTSGIRSILEDRHGNIWFGSHSEGVAKYDGSTFTYFTTQDGLSNNQVRSIYEDQNGIVWFECGFGISRYDNNQINSFENKDFTDKENWKLDSKDLWFKGDEEIGYNSSEGSPGVYHWNGSQMNFLAFPMENIQQHNNVFSISTPFTNGKDNIVWFGTYGAAFGFDGQTISIIDDKRLEKDNISGNLHIRSIYEDSQGTLWIGNNGIGVLTFKNGKLSNFSDDMGLISENSPQSGGHRSPEGSLEHVFAIGEDQQGNIWFGDRDTGAWRYDGTSMKNFTTEDGIETTHIWQILKTKNDQLWFAMGDGMVLQFKEDRFTRVF